MKKNIDGTGWRFPISATVETTSAMIRLILGVATSKTRREQRPRKSFASDSTRVYTWPLQVA